MIKPGSRDSNFKTYVCIFRNTKFSNLKLSLRLESYLVALNRGCICVYSTLRELAWGIRGLILCSGNKKRKFIPNISPWGPNLQCRVYFFSVPRQFPLRRSSGMRPLETTYNSDHENVWKLIKKITCTIIIIRRNV